MPATKFLHVLSLSNVANRVENAVGNYYRTDEQWTAFLVFCNVAIVLGTSFMDGYNFRVAIMSTTKLHASLIPPSDQKPLPQSSSIVGIDTNATVFIDHLANEKLDFARYCFVVFFAAKLLGMLTLSSLFGDKFGRTRTLMIYSVLAVVASSTIWIIHAASLCSKSAMSYQCLLPNLAGQTILGFQAGVGIVIAPTLLVELAPQNLRGACGTFHELFFVFGATIAIFNGTLFPTRSSYLYHLIFSFMVQAIHCLLLMFAVESPRWLRWKGSHQKAQQALKKLRAADTLLLEREFDEMSTGDQPVVSWCRFFWLVGIGAVLSSASWLTGRDVMDVFGTLGLRFTFGSRILALTYIIASLLTILGSFGLVDRIARRQLATVGLLAMSVILIVLTIFTAAINEIFYLAELCAIFFTVAFSLGPGPISAFMSVEMFDLKNRLRGVSFSKAIGFSLYLAWRFLADFCSNFAMSMSPYLLPMIFTIICLMVLIILLFFLPETIWGSLEEVSGDISSSPKMLVVSVTCCCRHQPHCCGSSTNSSDGSPKINVKKITTKTPFRMNVTLPTIHENQQL